MMILSKNSNLKFSLVTEIYLRVALLVNFEPQDALRGFLGLLVVVTLGNYERLFTQKADFFRIVSQI